MDEIQKTEMRNYTMAAGFFVIAMQYLLMIMMPPVLILDAVSKITVLLLILTGVILIVLKNRDLTAITFLMIGMLFAFMSLSQDKITVSVVIGIFMLILAAIILTAGDTKKYLLFILPALIGLGNIIPATVMVIPAVIAAAALYFAFACASERIALPGGTLLKKDVVTDFKASGSVLGYLLFGVSTAVWTAVYFFNASSAAALVLDSVCGSMMIFSGVLLFAVGKMRFTPVMFILMGFLVYIGQFMTGTLLYVGGGMFIVLGLFALLRTESRILPALMMILYGLTAFVSSISIGSSAVPVVSAVLNLTTALISVYLAFAVFGQRKLPLF